MTTQTQEPRINVFFSHGKSLQVVTPRGGRITFVAGKYYTRKEEEIQFLQEMAADGRGVYVDPNMVTIAESDRDPMTALKNKLREEILAEIAAQTNPANDRGESVQGRLNAASTSDIAPVAAGGDASQLHAQVAKLVPGKTAK